MTFKVLMRKYLSDFFLEFARVLLGTATNLDPGPAPITLPPVVSPAKEYRIGWSGPPRREVETLQEGER
jgi:hypothetical protein